MLTTNLSFGQICPQNIDRQSMQKPVKQGQKEFIYDKVDNNKRAELLRLLQEEKRTLKEASEILRINYSTAKTIIRVFRKENRIFKKSAVLKDSHGKQEESEAFSEPLLPIKPTIRKMENFQNYNNCYNFNFFKNSQVPNNFHNYQNNNFKNLQTLSPVVSEKQTNVSNNDDPCNINNTCDRQSPICDSNMEFKMLNRKIKRDIDLFNNQLRKTYTEIMCNKNMLGRILSVYSSLSNNIRHAGVYPRTN
jgi:hypothetical protein